VTTPVRQELAERGVRGEENEPHDSFADREQGADLSAPGLTGAALVVEEQVLHLAAFAIEKP
jgi:hypothetical protein